jgi:hypothetical protein
VAVGIVAGARIAWSLRCLSSRRVIAWVEDYQRMRSRSDTSPFLAEAMTVATFDPGLYEVVEIFHPEQTKAKR